MFSFYFNAHAWDGKDDVTMWYATRVMELVTLMFPPTTVRTSSILTTSESTFSSDTPNTEQNYP